MFEKLERGVFQDSHGVELRVDHGATAIPGELRLIQMPDGLDFEFRVHDSSFGREVLRWVRAGECEGCSVAYRHAQQRKDPFTKGTIILSAELFEISLCRSAQPAWYDTYARVTA
jgi:HK97 family phage prohead protease